MFRLALWHKGQEIVAQEDPTDDDAVAIFNCRRFQEAVLPILQQLEVKNNVKRSRRIKESDIERRITRIHEQLSFPVPGMNGKH